MRVIVGVTGASGSIYGWRLLEKLRVQEGVETHLIMSRSGERTAFLELGKAASDFKALANFHYPVEDIGCRLASGSMAMDAMIVAPCSIHTMSAIAVGVSSNLLIRAADVSLKERRKLILMVRETPLHLGHLRTMVALTEMGADGHERSLPSDKFYIPGSLLKVKVDNTNPLAFGMPDMVDVFFDNSPVFKLNADAQQKQIGRAHV